MAVPTAMVEWRGVACFLLSAIGNFLREAQRHRPQWFVYMAEFLPSAICH